MAFQFCLDDTTIHVWAVPIRPSDAVVTDFQDILSSDERERASRFCFTNLQRTFVFTRGLLRVLLSRYLSIRASEVSFQYGPRGKPMIDIEAPIRFNTSHSGETVFFAFSRECELGVDVEQIRALPDMPNIASRFFCDEEASQLASIPDCQRDRAFFQCWTRKEAYLKATGDGLSTPLDSFCVSVVPHEVARIIHIGGDRSAAENWTLHDLAFSEQYAATLAYRDVPRPLRMTALETIEQVKDIM
jgi:4'-phosphopantetheinyl transferase